MTVVFAGPFLGFRLSLGECIYLGPTDVVKHVGMGRSLGVRSTAHMGLLALGGVKAWESMAGAFRASGFRLQ